MNSKSGQAVSVENLVTRIGGATIHRGISFAISYGKIAALVGGSGAGKSVLLKVLMGLLKPASGKVSVLGERIDSAGAEELKALRRRFGVLFQNGALFSAQSVINNVSIPLIEQTKLPREIIEDIAAVRLKLNGIDEQSFFRMPSELSGGMLKRVALARALALEPEILFLDEPTSGLDPINARSFERLISSLSKNLGLTVLLVTHDVETLVNIAEQVIVLGDGKILDSGSVEDVRRSSDEWTRSYFEASAIGAL